MSKFELLVDEVPYHDFPDYLSIIGYPTNISQILTRLKNSFYRKITSFLWEIQLLYENTLAYNEPDSKIVRQAHILSIAVRKLVVQTLKSECPDPQNEIRRLIKSYSSDSDTESDAESENEQTWTTRSIDYFSSILEFEYVKPFAEPVDENEFPEYKTVVKSPISIQDILEKLNLKKYSAFRQVTSDMNLLQKNVLIFTPDKRNKIHKLAKRLKEHFEKRKKYLQHGEEYSVLSESEETSDRESFCSEKSSDSEKKVRKRGGRRKNLPSRKSRRQKSWLVEESDSDFTD